MVTSTNNKHRHVHESMQSNRGPSDLEGKKRKEKKEKDKKNEEKPLLTTVWQPR